MKKRLILSVSHHIYLARDARYALHEGAECCVLGVSVPIWFYVGSTSEPGEELFCMYELENTRESESFIKPTENGYRINLPQIPADYKPPKRIPDEQWRKLTRPQQEDWHTNHPVPISSKCLLDYEDIGGKYLSWTQHDKLIKDNKVLSIKNFVEVKDMDYLLETMVF